MIKLANLTTKEMLNMPIYGPKECEANLDWPGESFLLCGKFTGCLNYGSGTVITISTSTIEDDTYRHQFIGPNGNSNGDFINLVKGNCYVFLIAGDIDGSLRRSHLKKNELEGVVYDLTNRTYT